MSGHITEPLLYIHQPTIQKPKAFMQDYYYDSKEKEHPKEVEGEMNDKAPEQPTGSFKDLSIDQKIAYLSDLPEGFPQIRCEFITEERNFRGVLLETTESSLKIRVLGKERVSIKKEDITDIIMLGF